MIEEMATYSNITSAKTRPDAGFEIRGVRQVRALASPMRQEIVDALEAGGPLAVAELAAHLGRAPDSLYFHLRRLEKVGLIVEVERRKNGRHVAVVYDVPARPVRIAPREASPAALDAVIGGVLRLAQRDYRRGLKNPTATIDGPARDLWGGRAKGWLGPKELERVNALIAELQRTFRNGSPGEGRRAVALAFVLAPVAKQSKGGGKTGTQKRGRSPREGRGS